MGISNNASLAMHRVQSTHAVVIVLELHGVVTNMLYMHARLPESPVHKPHTSPYVCLRLLQQISASLLFV